MKGKEEGEEEANRFPSANHCPCFDIARLINMEVDERRREGENEEVGIPSICC